MTEDQITEWENQIDNMSHGVLASLYRFAPTSHPIFDKKLPLYDRFIKRFVKFGCMTEEISKEIGW